MLLCKKKKIKQCIRLREQIYGIWGKNGGQV